MILVRLIIQNAFPISSQKSSQNSNKIEMIPLIFMLFWSIVLVGVACNFGDMLTHEFEMIDCELCRCDWYLCPMDVQRLILIVSANTQRSPIVTGFGNVQCTRESFKGVKW